MGLTPKNLIRGPDSRRYVPHVFHGERVMPRVKKSKFSARTYYVRKHGPAHSSLQSKSAALVGLPLPNHLEGLRISRRRSDCSTGRQGALPKPLYLLLASSRWATPRIDGADEGAPPPVSSLPSAMNHGDDMINGVCAGISTAGLISTTALDQWWKKQHAPNQSTYTACWPAMAPCSPPYLSDIPSRVPPDVPRSVASPPVPR